MHINFPFDIKFWTAWNLSFETKMSSVTILVVDDFEPFRRFVRPILEGEAGLQIIGETSDGLKAVQKIENQGNEDDEEDEGGHGEGSGFRVQGSGRKLLS